MLIPITDEEGINDSNNIYEVQIKNTCNLMVLDLSQVFRHIFMDNRI